MFGKRKTSPGGANRDPREEAMQAAISQAENDDPLIRAKIGGTAIKSKLYETLQKRDPNGIHVDTVLGILGSLSGFSCILYAYFAARAGHGANDPSAIAVVTGADGRKYFFGNLPNHPLLEDEHSVWSLVGGMAEHLGTDQLPDITEIVKHVSATVGSVAFGVPRMPNGHELSDSPKNFVRQLWPALIEDVKVYTVDPAQFPIVFGFAIQQVMQDARDVIDPGLAAKIAMECAVPMSKIDPNTVFD